MFRLLLTGLLAMSLSQARPLIPTSADSTDGLLI